MRFRVIAPDGSIHQRRSRTKHYSHALLAGHSDGTWAVLRWARDAEHVYDAIPVERRGSNDHRVLPVGVADRAK